MSELGGVAEFRGAELDQHVESVGIEPSNSLWTIMDEENVGERCLIRRDEPENYSRSYERMMNPERKGDGDDPGASLKCKTVSRKKTMAFTCLNRALARDCNRTSVHSKNRP
jgi:hypothetical protein